MDKLERNKSIIAKSVYLLVLISICIILAYSEYNGILKFRYVLHGNTGEPLSFLFSIICYILFWGVAGIFPSAFLYFFIIFVGSLLHRNEVNRPYLHRDEDSYGFNLAFKAAYAGVLFLMILHISNLVTIHIFS